MITINIDPCAKPRATQRDKWNPSKETIKYRAWADVFRTVCSCANLAYRESWTVEFHIPMPKSWSKKKRDEMNGCPHRQRQDGDNLEKAFLDALFGYSKDGRPKYFDADDCVVWEFNKKKFWSETGKIVIL